MAGRPHGAEGVAGLARHHGVDRGADGARRAQRRLARARRENGVGDRCRRDPLPAPRPAGPRRTRADARGRSRRARRVAPRAAPAPRIRRPPAPPGPRAAGPAIPGEIRRDRGRGRRGGYRGESSSRPRSASDGYSRVWHRAPANGHDRSPRSSSDLQRPRRYRHYTRPHGDRFRAFAGAARPLVSREGGPHL